MCRIATTTKYNDHILWLPLVLCVVTGDGRHLERLLLLPDLHAAIYLHFFSRGLEGSASDTKRFSKHRERDIWYLFEHVRSNRVSGFCHCVRLSYDAFHTWSAQYRTLKLIRFPPFLNLMLEFVYTICCRKPEIILLRKLWVRHRSSRAAASILAWDMRAMGKKVLVWHGGTMCILPPSPALAWCIRPLFPCDTLSTLSIHAIRQ